MSLQPSEVEITQEDQAKINNFSRINMMYLEKSESIKTKKQQQKNLEDLVEELDFMDEDDVVQTKFGECFLNIKASKSLEIVKTNLKNLSTEIQQLEKEVKDHDKKLKNLKTVLYSKFGTNIQLEME